MQKNVFYKSMWREMWREALALRISPCEKGVMWRQPSALLSSMARERIDKETITCNAAISACEKGGMCGRHWHS